MVLTAYRIEAVRAQLGDVYARNMLAHVRAEAVTR
jgi:hypothetical protein